MTHHRDSGGSLRSKKMAVNVPHHHPPLWCPVHTEAKLFGLAIASLRKAKASFPIHSEKRERVSDFNAAARGQHGFSLSQFSLGSSLDGVRSKILRFRNGTERRKKKPCGKAIFTLCVARGLLSEDAVEDSFVVSEEKNYCRERKSWKFFLGENQVCRKNRRWWYFFTEDDLSSLRTNLLLP